MKKLTLLLLVALTISCSGGDDDVGVVEYISSVDGYWVKSRTASVQGMCNNDPVQPTTVTWDWFYKFDLNTYFNQMYWRKGPTCDFDIDPSGNNLGQGFIESCKTYMVGRQDSILGETGFIGSVIGNVITWDMGSDNAKITLSNDRKSLTVDIGWSNNHREDGTYILVSKEDADAMLNSQSSCPQ